MDALLGYIILFLVLSIVVWAIVKVFGKHSRVKSPFNDKVYEEDGYREYRNAVHRDYTI